MNIHQPIDMQEELLQTLSSSETTFAEKIGRALQIQQKRNDRTNAIFVAMVEKAMKQRYKEGSEAIAKNQEEFQKRIGIMMGYLKIPTMIEGVVLPKVNNDAFIKAIEEATETSRKEAEMAASAAEPI